MFLYFVIIAQYADDFICRLAVSTTSLRLTICMPNSLRQPVQRRPRSFFNVLNRVSVPFTSSKFAIQLYATYIFLF